MSVGSLSLGMQFVRMLILNTDYTAKFPSSSPRIVYTCLHVCVPTDCGRHLWAPRTCFCWHDCIFPHEWPALPGGDNHHRHKSKDRTFFWLEFSHMSFWFKHERCARESCVLQAHISFSPTLEQQQKCPGCESTIIDGDFIIKYDVKREKALGYIQVRKVSAAALGTQSYHLLWDCRNNVFFLL